MIAIVNIPVRVKINPNIIVTDEKSDDASIDLFEITHEPIINTPYFRVTIKHLGRESKHLRDLELTMSYEDLKTLLTEPSNVLNNLYCTFADDISSYELQDKSFYSGDYHDDRDEKNEPEVYGNFKPEQSGEPSIIANQWTSKDGKNKSIYVVNTMSDKEFDQSLKETLDEEFGEGNYIYISKSRLDEIAKEIDFNYGDFDGILPTTKNPDDNLFDHFND